MNSRPDDFDPRFDPAFQRGFDGTAAADAPNVARRDARRATPVRPPEPIAGPAQPRASAPTVGQPPRGTDSVDPGRADDAALEPRPRTNPFLIALGVVSVALVAAGVWGIQAARAPFLATDTASNVDFVGLQILQFLSPVAIALGVATAIGILFVYATDWQRRR
jgi:hypothetical protein